MVNSTSSSMPPLVTSYLQLEEAIFAELNILKISDDHSNFLKAKVYQIEEATHRLGQAVILKCQLKKEDHPIAKRFYAKKIDPLEAESTTLLNDDDMLDASFSVDINSNTIRSTELPAEFVKCISIRQALNIARYNPINVFNAGY